MHKICAIERDRVKTGWRRVEGYEGKRRKERRSVIVLGTSLHHTLSTNVMPPYRPLAPSPSSAEEGEGDMDRVKMTRRERDRRLKLGRSDDDDKGGKGRECVREARAASLMRTRPVRHAREECLYAPVALPRAPHSRFSLIGETRRTLPEDRELGCTSNPLLEIRAALEAAAFLQSVVPGPLDPALPEDEHSAARIRPRSWHLLLCSFPLALPAPFILLAGWRRLACGSLPGVSCIRVVSALFPSSPLSAPRSPFPVPHFLFSFLLHLAHDGLCNPLRPVDVHSTLWIQMRRVLGFCDPARALLLVFRDLARVFHSTRCSDIRNTLAPPHPPASKIQRRTRARLPASEGALHVLYLPSHFLTPLRLMRNELHVGLLSMGAPIFVRRTALASNWRRAPAAGDKASNFRPALKFMQPRAELLADSEIIMGTNPSPNQTRSKVNLKHDDGPPFESRDDSEEDEDISKLGYSLCQVSSERDGPFAQGFDPSLAWGDFDPLDTREIDPLWKREIPGYERCRKEVVDGVQKWRETSASVNEVKRGCSRLEAHWRRSGEEGARSTMLPLGTCPALAARMVVRW
ncbi:hypothetical protein DFH09DRAFT_1397930 [Mycena vulgaris]|nr:hypothetical protein DFH09DRAFT_1397930 [Mycena vulgaris]